MVTIRLPAFSLITPHSRLDERGFLLLPLPRAHTTSAQGDLCIACWNRPVKGGIGVGWGWGSSAVRERDGQTHTHTHTHTHRLDSTFRHNHRGLPPDKQVPYRILKNIRFPYYAVFIYTLLTHFSPYVFHYKYFDATADMSVGLCAEYHHRHR